MDAGAGRRELLGPAGTADAATPTRLAVRAAGAVPTGAMEPEAFIPPLSGVHRFSDTGLHFERLTRALAPTRPEFSGQTGCRISSRAWRADLPPASAIDFLSAHEQNEHKNDL